MEINHNYDYIYAILDNGFIMNFKTVKNAYRLVHGTPTDRPYSVAEADKMVWDWLRTDTRCLGVTEIIEVNELNDIFKLARYSKTYAANVMRRYAGIGFADCVRIIESFQKKQEEREQTNGN